MNSPTLIEMMANSYIGIESRTWSVSGNLRQAWITDFFIKNISEVKGQLSLAAETQIP